MGRKYSGKIYKFSDGLEVVVSPMTVGDYISMAKKYLSNVTKENIFQKRADVYVAQFSYLIKEIVGQTFVSDDFKNKFVHDYICDDIYRISDQKVLDDIESETSVDIKPIIRPCSNCGELMEVYVSPSNMSFSGYNCYYPQEFYEISKNTLPSKGIPYPENLQIHITPLTLSEQKLLEHFDQANYYSKLLDGIYISGCSFDREQLLFADIEFLDTLRRIYVYDTNSKITGKSYQCEHCGEHCDVSFKIDELQFEDMPKEMFETFEYKKTEHCNKEQAKSYRIKADELFEDENYEEAIEYYSKAIELDPEDADAYRDRAHAYRILDQDEDAIRDYDKIIELDPEDVDAYKSRATAYSILSQYEEAISDYTKAIELDPEDDFAYLKRSLIYLDLEQYENAIRDYDKIIELAPEDDFAYYKRADAYSKLERYEDAISNCNKAIELAPEDDFAYYKRADVYLKLERYEDAISDYNKVIELDPENVDAYYNRGEVKENLKQYKDAIADFRKALELCDDDYPQDKSDCENRIRKIEQLLSKPVKISECSEEELGTLKLFNKERIEQFFKARNEGIMWYDIEKFAEYFNLQPHEIVQIQDRLVFPLKNSAKHGRKIDF